MKMLSNGMPSTLKSYQELTEQFFGKGSAQAEFINEKISKSLKGEDEEVIVDESQMLMLLGSMPQRNLP